MLSALEACTIRRGLISTLAQDEEWTSHQQHQYYVGYGGHRAHHLHTGGLHGGDIGHK